MSTVIAVGTAGQARLRVEGLSSGGGRPGAQREDR